MRSLIIAAGLSLALFAGPAAAGVPSVNMQFHELVAPECSSFDAVCIRQHMLAQQDCDPTDPDCPFPNNCFRNHTCRDSKTQAPHRLPPPQRAVKPGAVVHRWA